jgi:hypothetical protein
MAETVRRECAPVLLGLGFRNPRQVDRARWGDGRLNTFIRWRGTTYEEISFQWDMHNRPKFFLNFETSEVERLPQGDEAASRLVRFGILSSWRSPSAYIGGGWFGPWRSPEGVAALAIRRILKLEDFLLRGEMDWCINVGPARPVSPRAPAVFNVWGDPWRDPESDYRPDAD